MSERTGTDQGLRYEEYLLNDDRRDILIYGIAFCKKRCKAEVEKCTII